MSTEATQTNMRTLWSRGSSSYTYCSKTLESGVKWVDAFYLTSTSIYTANRPNHNLTSSQVGQVCREACAARNDYLTLGVLSPKLKVTTSMTVWILGVFGYLCRIQIGAGRPWQRQCNLTSGRTKLNGLIIPIPTVDWFCVTNWIALCN